MGCKWIQSVWKLLARYSERLSWSHLCFQSWECSTGKTTGFFPSGFCSREKYSWYWMCRLCSFFIIFLSGRQLNINHNLNRIQNYRTEEELNYLKSFQELHKLKPTLKMKGQDSDLISIRFLPPSSPECPKIGNRRRLVSWTVDN